MAGLPSHVAARVDEPRQHELVQDEARDAQREECVAGLDEIAEQGAQGQDEVVVEDAERDEEDDPRAGPPAPTEQSPPEARTARQAAAYAG